MNLRLSPASMVLLLNSMVHHIVISNTSTRTSVVDSALHQADGLVKIDRNNTTWSLAT